MMFIGWFKPFTEARYNYMEMFNEYATIASVDIFRSSMNLMDIGSDAADNAMKNSIEAKSLI